MRSSSPRAAFHTWSCERIVPDHTRNNDNRPTNGSAVVLNTSHEEWAILIGRHRDRLAATVDGVHRLLLGGGGQIAHDGIEQLLDADVLDRRGQQDRGEDALPDALVEARLELGIRDGLALEVLVEDVVVRLRGGLEQLVPAKRHLGCQVVGHGDLVTLAVLVDPGPAVDHVHVAPEGIGPADGDLERRDLAAELVAEGIDGRHRVRVLAIAAGDDEEGRASLRPALGDGVLGARPDGRTRVGGDERPIDRGERGDHLTHEVGIAGGVDDGDAMVVMAERRDRERQRQLALLLLGLRVEARGAVVHATGTGDGTGGMEHVLGEGGLPGAGLACEHEVPQA